MNVVICGAGAIGVAVAYYLAQRGVAATVVERSGVACAASGKAGGFLALDWCDGTPLAALARTSFALHAELARTLGAEHDYGYRRLTTLAATASKGAGAPQGWLDGAGLALSTLGTPATTAQVHPEKFTRALLQAACARGAKLIIGCVEGIELSENPKAVRGVRIDGAVLPADAVVIAMGPWSAQAAEWLPLAPVTGLKGHSIVLRPRVAIPAQALFIDDLEVYPRPDGTVYLCGLSEEESLPPQPEAVRPHPSAGRALQQATARLSSALADLAPERVQACFRPVYADGLPLLGSVPGVSGAYSATGHSCWGILNAPASGLALAELIADGRARSVDLAPFDPQRAHSRSSRATGWT